VAYWTDIFTLETWAQARSREFAVTGFPAPTRGKGGYSVSMFERVSEGDVFLCYCKAPASRWIGALRVAGEVFQSDEPVWGLTETGDARYPWRYAAEPLVALNPEEGIPGEEVASQLAILKRVTKWYTFLQRSLNRVPDEDGERLLALLQQPRKPVPIEVPKGTRRRRAGVVRPEPTLLDAKAVSLQMVPVTDEELDALARPEPRTHTEIQAKLRDIGLHEGFDVWVADRGVEWNGKLLGEGCLTDLPVVAAERTRVVMRGIDVIWFRKSAGHPERFFEIEHSTSVYSGLLRFNDVMIDFPIPEAFVVGEGEKRGRSSSEKSLGERSSTAASATSRSSSTTTTSARHG
jgi:hypothetical protein